MIPKITLYLTAACPYCLMAERLLKRKGVTQVDRIRVDLDPLRRVEMVQKTGRRTVPQIYINETHVGGFEDLAALDHTGTLDGLLAGGHDFKESR